MEMLVIATSVGEAPRADDDYLGKSRFGDEGGESGGVSWGGCISRDETAKSKEADWRYFCCSACKICSNLISIYKLEGIRFRKELPLTEHSIFVPFQFPPC